MREAPRALAGAIGLIAAARLAAGLAQDPAAIDANYVRRSDAERRAEFVVRGTGGAEAARQDLPRPGD